jgi:hypothetical protein
VSGLDDMSDGGFVDGDEFDAGIAKARAYATEVLKAPPGRIALARYEYGSRRYQVIVDEHGEVIDRQSAPKREGRT